MSNENNDENNQTNQPVDSLLVLRQAKISRDNVAALFGISVDDRLIDDIVRICKYNIKKKIDGNTYLIKALVAMFKYLQNQTRLYGMDETFRVIKRILADGTEIVDIFDLAGLAAGIGMEAWNGSSSHSAATQLVNIFLKSGVIIDPDCKYYYKTNREQNAVLRDPNECLSLFAPSGVNSWTELQTNAVKLLQVKASVGSVKNYPNTCFYAEGRSINYTVTSETLNDTPVYEEQHFTSQDKAASFLGAKTRMLPFITALKWKAVEGGVGSVASDVYVNAHHNSYKKVYFVECFLGNGSGGKSSLLGKKRKKSSSKTKKSKKSKTST